MISSSSLLLFFTQATRVLAVGDSWALSSEAPLEASLLGHGAPADVVSIGVPGSHASVWASPAGCASIQAWLGALPMVDTVHIELGINDLLSSWTAAATPAELQAIAASIADDVQAVADCAQAHAPGLEVVSRCYDFPNFGAFPGGQCGALWAAAGSPTPAEVNGALIELDAALAERALWDPRWIHVGAQGSTQALGGGPVDPAAPSPAGLLVDCLHLRGSAAAVFEDSAWAPFYLAHLGTQWSPSYSGLVPGTAGVTNSLSIADGFPFEQVVFVYALALNPTPAGSCPGMVVLSPWPSLVGAATADASGAAALSIFVPAELAGIQVWTQALLLNLCLGTQPARATL